MVRSCASDRQWIWQSCNEFGYFQTATAAAQPFAPFGKGLDLRTAGRAVCEAAFGPAPSPGASASSSAPGAYRGPDANALGLRANSEYGGRRVQGINITMPTGSMDPWHALGVALPTDPWFQAGNGTDPAALQALVPCPVGPLRKIAACVDVVEIANTAHCRDMYAPNTFAALEPPIEDTPEVVAAHARIAADVAFYVSG